MIGHYSNSHSKFSITVNLKSMILNKLYLRKVAELNKIQINYSQIKYYEFEKLFPVDLVLASDLIYHSEGEEIVRYLHVNIFLYCRGQWRNGEFDK